MNDGSDVTGKKHFIITSYTHTHLYLLLIDPFRQRLAQLAVHRSSWTGVSLKHASAVEEQTVDLIHLDKRCAWGREEGSGEERKLRSAVRARRLCEPKQAGRLGRALWRVLGGEMHGGDITHLTWSCNCVTMSAMMWSFTPSIPTTNPPSTTTDARR